MICNSISCVLVFLRLYNSPDSGEVGDQGQCSCFYEFINAINPPYQSYETDKQEYY